MPCLLDDGEKVSFPFCCCPGTFTNMSTDEHVLWTVVVIGFEVSEVSCALSPGKSGSSIE